MDKAKSNYYGFAGETQKKKVAFASEVFKRDYESIRTTYESYGGKNKPSSAKTQHEISKGSESAIKRVQRAGETSDNQDYRESRNRDSAAEANRPPMSKKWTEKG